MLFIMLYVNYNNIQVMISTCSYKYLSQVLQINTKYRCVRVCVWLCFLITQYHVSQGLNLILLINPCQ